MGQSKLSTHRHITLMETYIICMAVLNMNHRLLLRVPHEDWHQISLYEDQERYVVHSRHSSCSYSNKSYTQVEAPVYSARCFYFIT